MSETETKDPDMTDDELVERLYDIARMRAADGTWFGANGGTPEHTTEWLAAERITRLRSLSTTADVEALREIINECREWFSDRQDADQPQGAPTPIPNDEMRMLQYIDLALAAIRSRGPSREGEKDLVQTAVQGNGSVIDPAWQLVPKEPTCAPISYRWLLKEPVGAEDWHYGDWPTADAAKRFAWNAVGHRTERADFEAAFVIEPLYVSPPAPRALLKEAVETSYATMTALRGLLSSTPAMQSRDFIGMGIKLNDAIDKARAALSSTASGGENG
jgi:hypothetical protein